MQAGRAEIHGGGGAVGGLDEEQFVGAVGYLGDTNAGWAVDEVRQVLVW